MVPVPSVPPDRGAEEYEALFQRAGLALVDVTPSASGFSVLEAVPR